MALAVGLAASCGGGDEPTAPPDDGLMDIQPAPASMRRLLARQYVNTVGQLFGDAAAVAAMPPRDQELNGFTSIGASQLSMTESLVGDYERSALAVASAAVGNSERIAELMACDPQSEGEKACYRAFVENLGRLAFRRPLDEDEIADYVHVAEVSRDALGDFYAGIEYTIASFLQSPSFLFQVAIGKPEEGRADRRLLEGYEMATRLSFFLTDTAPDEAMLDAAARGELDDAEGVRRLARELLAQPAARTAVRGFFEEYLVLGGLESLAKDPSKFPEFNPSLARSMRLETLHLVEDVVFNRNASIRELFTADYTWIDDNLARHYGVTGPSEQTGWTRASLPLEQQRGGILTHASILSRQAHSDSTSATYRGLFILERFFCRTMPPPPPNVDPTLPPSSQAPTLRDRIKVHQDDEVCRTCHYEVDNLGLALEKFDAVGRFRQTENGAPIDTRVELDTIGTFNGARELGKVLAEREEVAGCMVRNVFRHATGHVEETGELRALRQLEERFAAHGYRFQELLVDLVSSDAFRTVGVSP